jgi:uncharacterized protein
MSVPREIQGQKYISLATFRRNGMPVHTAVWFAEDRDRLYVTTRNDSGKYKRLLNSPRAQVAPCSIRGNITGPVFEANARVVPAEEWPRVRRIIGRKYWLTRISSLCNKKKNVYLEVEVLPKLA